MTERRAADLRGALSAHETGRGKRYDAALKAQAMDLASQRRSEGQSWRKVAEELGLRVETVRRWCEGSAPKGVRMRTVESVMAPEGRGVVVVSPRGLRVEGLTIDQAVVLLRALG
jgi:predicted transcriptional regulator